MLGGRPGLLPGPIEPGMPGTMPLPYGRARDRGVRMRVGVELQRTRRLRPSSSRACRGALSRVLRHPEPVTTVPNISTKAPPVRTRLSRSIDMTSSFLMPDTLGVVARVCYRLGRMNSGDPESPPQGNFGRRWRSNPIERFDATESVDLRKGPRKDDLSFRGRRIIRNARRPVKRNPGFGRDRRLAVEHESGYARATRGRNPGPPVKTD